LKGADLIYEKLIENFINWAQTRKDVRSAVVIGSRARTDHPADEWSDLDIVIVSINPESLILDTDWVKGIDNPWIVFIESTAIGDDLECRVLFEGGYDIDFAIIPYYKIEKMIEGEIPFEAADIFCKGVRILLDKDGILSKLMMKTPTEITYQYPSERDFINLVNDFWYHTVWTAKHLRRGEFFWAKSCCDGHLKGLLVKIIGWNVKIKRGPQYNIWHRGRFLEEWAELWVLEKLKSAYSYYSEEDIWRALFVTMDIFRPLAIETSKLLGYQYPQFEDEKATELVNSFFNEKKLNLREGS